MKYKIEKDSMGEVFVEEGRYWGAQTERSRTNFRIGEGCEPMPREIVSAFGIVKKAAAITNFALRPDKMTEEKCATICKVCDEVSAWNLLDAVQKSSSVRNAICRADSSPKP